MKNNICSLFPCSLFRIWNYLTQLVDKLGTTIILTTHYIEEARFADTVRTTMENVLFVLK